MFELGLYTADPMGMTYRPYQGLDVPGMDPTMGMGVSWLLGWLQQQGFMPGMLPLAGGDMNMWHRMQLLQQTQAHNAMMKMAAEADRENMMRTLRGMSAMFGVPWETSQIRAAGRIADAFGMAMPHLAEAAPELMDQMMGRRGSAAVMAHYMWEATRYRDDIIMRDGEFVRQRGMTPESVIDMHQGLWESMYGPAAMATRGAVLPAGQTGRLFAEMTRLGMMPGLDIPDDLTGMTEEGVADLQGANLTRVRETLENYQGVVRAMREVFGETGRPDAPMAEIIAGLQALTGGALSQLPAEQLEMTVRRMHELARSSGLGVQGMSILTAGATQQALQLGINPAFAPQAAEMSMAFRTAYMTTGMGAVTGWGVPTIDDLTRVVGTQTMQAAASPMANMAGLALRLREMEALGPQGEAWLSALQLGRTEYAFGDVLRPVTFDSQQDFVNMLTAGGLDVGTINSMLRQGTLNQSRIHEANMAENVRRVGQRAELERRMVDIAVQRGLTVAQAEEAVGVTFGVRPEQMTYQGVEDALRAHFGARLAPTTLSDVVGRWAEEPRMAMHGELPGVLRTMGDVATRAIEGERFRADIQAQISRAMAPLGVDTVTGRVVDFLQTIHQRPRDANLVQLFGAAVGMEFPGEAAERLETTLSALQDARLAIEEIEPGMDQAERNRRFEVLREESLRARRVAEGLGISTLTEASLERMRRYESIGDWITHREHFETAGYEEALEMWRSAPENIVAAISGDPMTLALGGAELRDQLDALLESQRELEDMQRGRPFQEAIQDPYFRRRYSEFLQEVREVRAGVERRRDPESAERRRMQGLENIVGGLSGVDTIEQLMQMAGPEQIDVWLDELRAGGMQGPDVARAYRELRRVFTEREAGEEWVKGVMEDDRVKRAAEILQDITGDETTDWSRRIEDEERLHELITGERSKDVMADLRRYQRIIQVLGSEDAGEEALISRMAEAKGISLEEARVIRKDFLLETNELASSTLMALEQGELLPFLSEMREKYPEDEEGEHRRVAVMRVKADQVIFGDQEEPTQ